MRALPQLAITCRRKPDERSSKQRLNSYNFVTEREELGDLGGIHSALDGVCLHDVDIHTVCAINRGSRLLVALESGTVHGSDQEYPAGGYLFRRLPWS